MEKKTVIVGAGLGGLFCGAILAKEGWPVLVLEKHHVAGGGLHTFKRNGQWFETGMHYVTGFEEGGALQRLCTYLGIMDKIEFSPLNPDAFDILRIGSQNTDYCFPLGEASFTQRLCAYFPHQREQIEAYMRDLVAMTDPVDMLWLRPSDHSVRYEQGRGLEPLETFMESYFSDPKLMSILLWNSALYGGRRNSSPAFLHAIISRFFIKGATRFAFGSQQLADALVALIHAHGGEVRVKAEVCKAELDHTKRMTAVQIVSGERIEGEYFISTVHPEVSLGWFPESAFSKAFCDRMKAQKHTDSTFSLFFTLKPEKFPFFNSNVFWAADYEDVCRPPVWEASGPRTIMATTPPMGKEGIFARSLKITAPISSFPFNRWKGTVSGARGNDYELCKQRYTELLCKSATTLFPNLPSAVETLFSATPLTYQTYSGSVDGSNYGFFKDCRDYHFSRLLPRTKIPNFFFSGQNLNMHGILGVPISAVITCGELVGLSQLLQKIDNDGISHYIS